MMRTSDEEDQWRGGPVARRTSGEEGHRRGVPVSGGTVVRDDQWQRAKRTSGEGD